MLFYTKKWHSDWNVIFLFGADEQIRTAYQCRLRRQTEELWAAMNVCPFAPEIDPLDRFLPAGTALSPQFGKVAPRCRSRGFLTLPASLRFRLAISATGGARLRAHYQDWLFVR